MYKEIVCSNASARKLRGNVLKFEKLLRNEKVVAKVGLVKEK